MPKHIHIIGICGVATGALAIAFRKAGVKITGSDKGFFPPVSTSLEEAGIPFYAGWHPEKMEAQGKPDAVIIGGSGKSSQNPEMIFAKENNIPIYSYPEIIEKYFLRENNIVCAGTWGKTSSSALLSFIFDYAGLNPTYMFGAISLSQKESAKITQSKWCILEGDEYTGSQSDNTAKFFHYHPTRLLLSSVSWDHADVYPTPELYEEAFQKLVRNVPQEGIIVVSDNKKAREITLSSKARVITYGKNGDYKYKDVKSTERGLSFSIISGDKEYPIKSPMLGDFQSENITGCFALADQQGIPPDKIIEAISEFRGIKRRLEKRLENEITIIDDIAHSPDKARAILSTLRQIYLGKIFAIFEPNTGARSKKSIPQYDKAFKDADEIILPRFTKIKEKENESRPLEADELVRVIAETHKGAYYIPNDEELIRHLQNHVKKGDVVVFLGSHGFRGMIEELIRTVGSD